MIKHNPPWPFCVRRKTSKKKQNLGFPCIYILKTLIVIAYISLSPVGIHYASIYYRWYLIFLMFSSPRQFAWLGNLFILFPNGRKTQKICSRISWNSRKTLNNIGKVTVAQEIIHELTLPSFLYWGSIEYLYSAKDRVLRSNDSLFNLIMVLRSNDSMFNSRHLLFLLLFNVLKIMKNT